MNKLIVSAALAAAITLGAAAPANAQAVAPAKIAIVDLDRVTKECNACKAAQGQLQQQYSTFQARANQLQTSLNPEQTYLEGQLKALAGKEPDATLKTRLDNFQRSQQAAAQELQGQQAQLQRNQAYVREQLLEKLNSLYAGVMNRHGANVMVEVGQTLASSSQLDVTADLLATLNSSLTTLQTVAPPPAQGSAAPAASGPSGR